MAEDINVQAFKAASELFSSTEVSAECELEVWTSEDTETDQILAYIHPESDLLFYPTDVNGKVIDPRTGEKVDLTNAFTLTDPKAVCIKSDDRESSNLPISIRDRVDEQQVVNTIPDNNSVQAEGDKNKITAPFSNSGNNAEKAARSRNSDSEENNIDDIIASAEELETRQIFIFRSGDKPTDQPILEIKDLQVPINEAGKPVFGDSYPDVDSEDLQEQGGVVIPDLEIPNVQKRQFELDSKSVSVFLNNIGLSSEFISNLQQGKFNGSELPEIPINLSAYQLGHIASGFVTGNFPSYEDELDSLGIYPRYSDSVTALENLNDNFEL